MSQEQIPREDLASRESRISENIREIQRRIREEGQDNRSFITAAEREAAALSEQLVIIRAAIRKLDKDPAAIITLADLRVRPLGIGI